jgi:flagellar FliL protein
MKKLIAGFLAFAVILGGGMVGASMVSSQAQAAEEKKDAQGEVGGISFVEMKPLVLPIVDRNGVSQIISLVVSLEVKDPAAAAEVEKYSPRLTDAFIQDMYGILTRQAAMEGGVVQVGYIKSRLNKVTERVLGQDKVKDVLLQVVQQRPV